MIKSIMKFVSNYAQVVLLQSDNIILLYYESIKHWKWRLFTFTKFVISGKNNATIIFVS